MKNLKPGHIVNLTLKEEDGSKLKLRAGILEVDDHQVTYVDVEAPGTCSVPREEISSCTGAAKPKTKAEKQALGMLPREPVKTIKKPKAKAAQGAPAPRKGSSKGPNKTERAREIMKANPGASKAEIKQMFMDQLDMKEAGANTYYLKLSKELT